MPALRRPFRTQHCFLNYQIDNSTSESLRYYSSPSKSRKCSGACVTDRNIAATQLKAAALPAGARAASKTARAASWKSGEVAFASPLALASEADNLKAVETAARRTAACVSSFQLTRKKRFPICCTFQSVRKPCGSYFVHTRACARRVVTASDDADVAAAAALSLRPRALQSSFLAKQLCLRSFRFSCGSTDALTDAVLNTYLSQSSTATPSAAATKTGVRPFASAAQPPAWTSFPSASAGVPRVVPALASGAAPIVSAGSVVAAPFVSAVAFSTLPSVRQPSVVPFLASVDAARSRFAFLRAAGACKVGACSVSADASAAVFSAGTFSSLTAAVLSLQTASPFSHKSLFQQKLQQYQQHRRLHNSHQATKLRRLGPLRDKHLDYVPSLQQEKRRERAAAAAAAAVAVDARDWSTKEQEQKVEEYFGEDGVFVDDAGVARKGILRVEKEKFLREMLQQQHAFSMLFTDEQRAELLGEKWRMDSAAGGAPAPEGDADVSADSIRGNPAEGSNESEGFKAAYSGQERGARAVPVAAESEGGATSSFSGDDQHGSKRHHQLEMFTGAALRTYRILRPEALSFYKEDSLLSLQSRLNEATLKHSPLLRDLQEFQQRRRLPPSAILPPDFDALQYNLPVVNPKGFVLALAAVSHSLAEDIEELCILLRVPGFHIRSPPYPFKLKVLLDALVDSFKLRKNPNYAGEWADKNWPRLERILPSSLAALSSKDVGLWLRGHLERVCARQRETAENRDSSSMSRRQAAERLAAEYYSLGDDFMYDGAVVSEEFLNERFSLFPLEKAGDLLLKVAKFFGLTEGPQPVINDAVITQFQNLVYTLKRIGFLNWMRMDTREIEKYLPEGDAPPFTASEKDIEAAQLLLKAATRGKGNLLDFEELDPFKLFYGFDAKTIEEELATLPENPFLSDKAAQIFFDVRAAAAALKRPFQGESYYSDSLNAFRKRYGKTPLEAVVESEERFLTTAGPAEWLQRKSSHQEFTGAAGQKVAFKEAATDGGSKKTGDQAAVAGSVGYEGEDEDDGDSNYVHWRWKRPLQTVYDPQKNVFVRERQGVDPTLSLHELRQTLLSISRMMSMNKQGRVYYFRAIVAVGNGRGLFGIGIAFGGTPKEARSNAALTAIQRMQFIDVDLGQTLTTPVRGREYSAEVKIIPRPLGRGLKSNLRYLPLLYLMGLDNCRVSFYGPKASARWFTRAKALKRALEQIQSRRTLANSTGQKYDLLVAPGEHWVHWPDRWFRPIVRDYQLMLQKIKLKRHKTYRRGFRSNIAEVIPEECRPEFTPYTWKSPLQRWAEEMKKKRLIAHNIYEKEVYVNPLFQQSAPFTANEVKSPHNAAQKPQTGTKAYIEME